MKKIFFDTWGWVAIAHKNDTHHKEVVSFYKMFLHKKGIPVTTDYVLSETITILRSRTSSKTGVSGFVDTLLKAVKEDRVLLERIDDRKWLKAWELSKRYGDKPNISFVDFSSFIVLKALAIKEVLTADRHFETVGFGFKKLF